MAAVRYIGGGSGGSRKGFFSSIITFEDHKVNVDAGDTADFLAAKISNGLGIQLSAVGPAGNRNLLVETLVNLGTFDYVGYTLRVKPMNIISFYNPGGGLPPAPADKDSYVSTATASGWTINRQYTWNAAAVQWLEYIPTPGVLVFNIADTQHYTWTGIIWQQLPFGTAGGCLGGSYPNPTLIMSRGSIVYNPSGIASGDNIIVWYAPFPCTVTNVRGYRVGGTGATINARINGASNHLASALSLTSADAWMDGGAVQNTAYAAGNKLEIMVVTVAGSPTQIAVQVDFTRP